MNILVKSSPKKALLLSSSSKSLEKWVRQVGWDEAEANVFGSLPYTQSTQLFRLPVGIFLQVGYEKKSHMAV